MTTKKDRLHSGRKTIFVKDEEFPYEETFYDDWLDYRDGFRDKKYLENKKRELNKWKYKK